MSEKKSNTRMMTSKVLNTGFLLIAIIILFFIFKIKKPFDNREFYQAGSGLDSVFDIGHEMYKSQYLQQYADTFLKVYTYCKPTSGHATISMISGYDF